MTLGISVLMLFAMLNSAASAYLPRYTPNLGYWLVNQKWQLLKRTDVAPDWVIVGDSSCNQGVDIETWTAVTGGTALNLCTVGDMLLSEDVWMLQDLVRRGGRPKKVLVVHVYDMWPRVPIPALLGQLPARRVWNGGSPRVSLDLAGSVEELLSRYVPLVSQNRALSSALEKPATFFDAKFAISERGYRSEREADPERVERSTASHVRALQDSEFRISAPNRSALEALKDMAVSGNMEIYLTTSPVARRLAAQAGFWRHVDVMRSELEAWAGASETLHYIDEIQSFPTDVMVNTDHVTHAGAQIYTRGLARLVSRASNAPGNAPANAPGNATGRAPENTR